MEESDARVCRVITATAVDEHGTTPHSVAHTPVLRSVALSLKPMVSRYQSKESDPRGRASVECANDFESSSGAVLRATFPSSGPSGRSVEGAGARQRAVHMHE